MEKKNFLIKLFILGFLIAGANQLIAQEQDSVFKEMNDFALKIGEFCPELGATFYALNDSIVHKEGSLSIKQKELIALGIAVYTGCEYCVYYHTAGAKKYGATNKEILEAASVAFYVGGGKAFSHIKYVFKALDELSQMQESDGDDEK